MSRLFGTDGVRGLANRDVTAEMALSLAVSAAHVLVDAADGVRERPLAVVGRDPRASGEFLQAAVMAGLASAGVDVLDVGVLPTPAVAHLTAAREATMGVVLSASHNAMPDNGIKFFAEGGTKLDDGIEDEIEDLMGRDWQRPVGAAVGRIRQDADAIQEYEDYVVSTVAPGALAGLRLVVDGANGAASVVAPEVYRRLGAEVIAIHCDPDGLTINDDCGSTHMESLQAAVLEHGADAGVAHDGDADRCLMVDERGELVDGDQMMAILAVAMRDAGSLRGKTLVATVMSNQGLRNAMRDQGIKVLDTAVGDRYVLEAMRAQGFALGGEQSGHIVMSEFATTGDGVMSASHVLAELKRRGCTLSELAAVMARLPQRLINVRGVDKNRLESNRLVQWAITGAAAELGDSGRVLLRKSGTEPLVRVMVEAATQEQADDIAERLAEVVKERLALK